MRWIIILKEHINNYPIKSTNLRDKSPIYKDNTKMNFGQNLMLIRKQKKLSQADLEKIIGTSGDVIGRYKRGDITPSVDVVAIIADALEVSVDYLIGKTKLVIDKNTLNRLEEISNLPEDKKFYVFNLIDICLRDFNTKKAYAG